MNFPTLISWVRRMELAQPGAAPLCWLCRCTSGMGDSGGLDHQNTGSCWPQGQHWRPQPLGKAAPPALLVTVLPAALQDT